MPTLDLHADSQSIDDDDAFDRHDDDDDAFPPTNRDADHHTIVDMNLRVVRFVVVVAVALVVAFAYATFTSKGHILTHASTTALAESRVTFYNVIFGPTMFATSKIFEIYTETLIFPTLHTYLHNCSLYPGDAPQRTTSTIKTRAIFWGLKTVVILMNVGTASLFVSSRTARNPTTTTTTAVAHSVETHARRLQYELSTPPPDRYGFAAFLQGGGGKSGVDRFREDTSTCGSMETSTWTRADVDYTSVAVPLARRPWSEQIVAKLETGASAEAPVVVHLRDCVEGITSACEQTLATHGFHLGDVAALLTQGALLQAGVAVEASRRNVTMREAAHALSEVVKTRDATLCVDQIHSAASGMTTLSAAVSFERAVPREAVSCGAHSCVASVSVSAGPPQELWIQQLDHGTTFLTSATSRSAVASTDGAAREVVLFSFASHTLSSPTLRLTIDEDGTQVVVPDLARLAQLPTRLAALHSVILPDASGLKTWMPIENATATPSLCAPLVDAYVAQFQQMSALFHPSQTTKTMTMAALLFLTQSATYVPSEAMALALARRLDEVTVGGAPGETVKLKLSITAYSAIATFAGCGIMVLLMVFVIWRPQARVRLTPNTTAAAQYVQILTDDLYPNIVHKKRLRFVNGEVLPFNEYVVDSIVLHAKRDETKKIYL